jgi:DNA-binding LytR/AlgR family response regulator
MMARKIKVQGRQRMKIGICDDESSLLSLLTKYVKEWCALRKIECEIDTYPSAEAFLFAYEDMVHYDLLMLDIQMQEMNGMELAKKLRSRKEEVSILFITGVKEYVFDGNSVDAISYLLKPVQKDRLMECLDKAYTKISSTTPYILLEMKGDISKVKTTDVFFVESNLHNTSFKTVGGTFKNSKGIQLEEELVSLGFFRPHRSFLINLAKVEKITKKDIYLEDGSIIPIARGRWEDVNLAYLAYHRKNLKCNITDNKLLQPVMEVY